MKSCLHKPKSNLLTSAGHEKDSPSAVSTNSAIPQRTFLNFLTPRVPAVSLAIWRTVHPRINVSHALARVPPRNLNLAFREKRAITSRRTFANGFFTIAILYDPVTSTAKFAMFSTPTENEKERFEVFTHSPVI